MTDEQARHLLRLAVATDDLQAWVKAGEALARQGAFLEAASALDRAYGRSPDDPSVSQLRKAMLDALEVREHGMTFRCVPAGAFLMGSEDGDPDERPVHRVHLDAFWIADVR